MAVEIAAAATAVVSTSRIISAKAQWPSHSASIWSPLATVTVRNTVAPRSLTATRRMFNSPRGCGALHGRSHVPSVNAPN
jgi:hypothetical protein